MIEDPWTLAAMVALVLGFLGFFVLMYWVRAKFKVKSGSAEFLWIIIFLIGFILVFIWSGVIPNPADYVEEEHLKLGIGVIIAIIIIVLLFKDALLPKWISHEPAARKIAEDYLEKFGFIIEAQEKEMSNPSLVASHAVSEIDPDIQLSYFLYYVKFADSTFKDILIGIDRMKSLATPPHVIKFAVSGKSGTFEVLTSELIKSIFGNVKRGSSLSVEERLKIQEAKRDTGGLDEEV